MHCPNEKLHEGGHPIDLKVCSVNQREVKTYVPTLSCRERSCLSKRHVTFPTHKGELTLTLGIKISHLYAVAFKFPVKREPPIWYIASLYASSYIRKPAK